MQQTYQFGKHVIPRCNVFLVTSLSYAFTNRKPLVPGHVLVSPLRPVKRFADLNQEEVSDLFCCVHRIVPVLQDVYSSTAMTIALQDGKDAGQTVEHVHVHILPRIAGDFRRNDDVYEELATHASMETDGEFRSIKDMQEEAEKLEKLLK